MNNLKHWNKDLRASLVVFLVALPLCLGIALASNAPLASGLIAGIVGGIVVGALSGSPISVSGPAAGLTVIVASAISDLGSFEAFSVSVILAGLLQILFGFMRGGTIGNYFPSSVIKGMLAAIGLILILKQLPHAVGYDSDFMGDESFYQFDGQNTFSEIARAIQSTHAGAIIVAMISLLIMWSWEKGVQKGKVFFQYIPGALIAVIASVFINEIFKFTSPELVIHSKHLVQLPFEGGAQDFFKEINFPQWKHLANSSVYMTAIVVALVASIESLLSIEAADKIDENGSITSKNRELLAQGFGNVVSGLLGGLPVTAVIVRTSANSSAGAKTRFSAIFHGLWLLGCVVLIPHLLSFIPLSCLAAILLLVGYKLTKPEIIRNIYHKGLNQFIPFAVTVIAILFTDLLVGILIGMGVGFFYVIKSSIHKSIVMVNDGNEFLIRFHKDASFLQKTALLKMFHKIPANASVVIDGSKNVYIDDDITDLIEDFVRRAASHSIKVELKKSSLALNATFKE